MKDELCSLCVMRGEGQPKGDPSPPSTRGVELGLGAHFSAASLLLPCCFLVSCIGCGNLSAGRAYRRGDRLLVAPWRQAWSQAGWPEPCVALVEMVEPWGLGLSMPWSGSGNGHSACMSLFSSLVPRTQQRSWLSGRVLFWADNEIMIFFHPLPKLCPTSSCSGQMRL